MVGTHRYIYLRGYSKRVEVLSAAKDAGYWLVLCNGKNETVHQDQFYHRNAAGMLIHRGVEFKRKYPGHDVAIEHLPGL